MGSKVIGFRVPDDLAVEFEQFCEGAGKTTGEVLRKLVDDMLYPESGRKRLEERRERLEERGEDLEGILTPIQLALDTLAQQLKGFDERLELVQVDRGLTEADKEHYDGALVELESRLAKLKEGVNKLVQTVNNNGEVCNDHFVKVARLFQFLAAHIHDGDGVVAVSPENLLKAEVELANKRLGKIEGQPATIQGQASAKGYRYLEHVGLSVREKE